MNNLIIFLSISLVCLIVGLLLIYSGNKKKRICTERITANIVEIEIDKAEDSKEKDTYRPIYEFEVNGNKYRNSIGLYSKSKKEYKIGDKRDILYNQKDPNEFIDAKRNTDIISGIILIVISILFIIFAIKL